MEIHTASTLTSRFILRSEETFLAKQNAEKAEFHRAPDIKPKNERFYSYSILFCFFTFMLFLKMKNNFTRIFIS